MTKSTVKFSLDLVVTEMNSGSVMGGILNTIHFRSPVYNRGALIAHSGVSNQGSPIVNGTPEVNGVENAAHHTTAIHLRDHQIKAKLDCTLRHFSQKTPESTLYHQSTATNLKSVK